MEGYVCGFLFSPDRSRVLLIRKRRPAWQAGRPNGVGGKMEPGETPAQALRREFREESGLDVPEARWQHVVTLAGPDWRGYFFRTFGDPGGARAATDEPLEVHPVSQLPPDVIPNLNWIIPLLLDDGRALGQYAVQVHAGGTRLE